MSSSAANQRLPQPSTEPSYPIRPQPPHSLRRMPSARDAVSSYSSPLTRLEAKGRSAKSHGGFSSAPTSRQPSNAYQASPNPPPVPALEFNLFRHNSIMSIDSLASDFTITDQSDEDDKEEESPATPKASTSNSSSYFESGNSTPTRSSNPSSSVPPSANGLRERPVASTSATSSNTQATRPLAPKRSFTVSSRPAPPITRTQPTSAPPFHLGPVPTRRPKSHSISGAQTREAPAHAHPDELETSEDWASVHGEQGSDWGDDESQFEWLDTENAPQAVNGVERRGSLRNLSPSKRLSKLKAAMGREGSVRLKKPLIIPKRAPPPPPLSAPAPPPLASAMSSTSAASSTRSPTSPPKGPSWQINKPASHPAMYMASEKDSHPLSARWTDRSGHPASPQIGNLIAPSQAGPLRPLMVPLKDDSITPLMGKSSISRQSHMSALSAYSYYDLDGGETSPSTPKADDPDMAFPKGKYMKVSASALEREKEIRERTVSEPSTRSPTTPLSLSGWTPDDLVHKGIEARGKGDLPKSAYYFMKAAEGGSSTGRMYWGLALRHGWGVGIDDKRAFAELRQACEESLAGGGIIFHDSPGHMKLTVLQRKIMTTDLAMGMFEVGNCFLDGIGVKKAPDVALQYMRSAANLGDIQAQEQLGQILSKGGHGIKKNMKEAAKWYRMAVAQGSTNTIGLSWIWKDKYSA